MFELTYIARPVIGALIGYITNDIAIRMLFRPRTPKYIFGYRIPFTPGLIPKEKARIASSIGDTISKNLMNREVLEKTLLSDDIIRKFENSFDSFVNRQKSNEESLEEFIGHYLTPEDISALRHGISSSLSAHIRTALIQADLGPRIASAAVEHVMNKVHGGLAGKFGAEHIVGFLAAPLEKLLAKNIEEMIENNSSEIAGSLITDQTASVLSKTMRELFTGHDKQLELIRASLINLYRRMVSDQLPKILDTVNISQMIEQRINEMDVRETERLIFEVMHKELKAIVWLGALLGFFMGCVNLLF